MVLRTWEPSEYRIYSPRLISDTDLIVSRSLCSAINRVAPMLPSQPPANHLVNLNLPPSSNSNRLPTHILALQSTRSDQKFLYPSHALLLAAHCTGVPPVPILPPGSTSLPVVQLKVTSPNLFPVLQAFLLTKSHETLISGLLPVSTSSLGSFSSLPPQQRTAKLGHMLYEKSRGSMQQLMTYSDQISAFWRLICALGVFDNDTWEVVDLTWDAVLGAMNLVIQNEDAGRGRRM